MDKLLVILFILIFSIAIVTVFSLKMIRKIMVYNKKEVEWNERENSYRNQLFCLNSMEKAMDSIQAQRHDFKNHITCIYGLLMLNKNKEALEYTKKFINKVEQSHVLLETGHPIVTSLLNMKLINAQRENIDFKTSIDLPKDIKLDMLEISIVLGNLLDNAVEACILTEDKFINLNIHGKNNCLIIRVVNSKSKKIKIDTENLEEGFTTKENSDGEHGFGLTNIREIVKKHGGEMELKDNINTFDVKVTIPLTEIEYPMVPIKSLVL